MKRILAIARREMGGFFASPIGWICLAAFTFIAGVNFTLGIWSYYEQYAQMMFNPDAMDRINVNDVIVSPMFDFLCVLMLFITPALSMRLFADDLRQRSIDLLLTSPVTSFQIVAGKFLGAVGFGGVLAAGALPVVAILYQLGDPDTGVVIANYVAFVLLTGAFLSAGLLASALTENQIVALVMSFVFNLFLWMFGWLQYVLPEGDFKEVVGQFAIQPHIEAMSKGVLHLTDFVYFLTFMGFFLFATTQRVESLRWR